MSIRHIPISALCICFMVFLALPSGSTGQMDHSTHTGHEGHVETREKVSGDAGEIKLHDTELLDQDGNAVRFVTDVLGDRIVVMNFIFTNCPTACPILTQIFVVLQEELGDRMGKEVALVSISVDPTRDIPPRLKKFAKEHGAGPGWTFLTGQKREVDHVLTGLDSYSVDIWEHATKVMVGDPLTGKWVNLYGFPDPDEIMEKVDEFRSRRERS